MKNTNTSTTFARGHLTHSLLLGLALSVLPFVRGQQPASGAPKADEAIQLEAFRVVTANDEGYLSQNSLSATGANANLMKIPQTVQIINEQLLRDLGVGDDFTSALQIAIGGLDRRSYNGGDDFFMWGFRVTTTLKDGLPYYSNGLNLNYDVARVEAIKGPSAMTFGQNSYVGGVFNWVTRKPTKALHYSVETVYGTNDYKRLALHASGPFSDNLRYRVDLGTTDSNGNGRKFSYYKNKFAGGEIEWDISKTSRLNLSASYQTEDDFNDLTMIDPGTGKIIQMPRDYTVSEPWSKRPKTAARATAMFTTVLGEKFVSRTVFGYANWTNDWLRDQTNGLNVAAHTIAKFTSSFSTSNHFASLQQDFVKDLTTGPVNHRITFGGDQRNEVNRNNTNLFNNINPNFNYLSPVYGASVPDYNSILAGGSNLKSRSRISGLYAQEQMTFWQDRVVALAGLRYNDQMTVSGGPNASGVGTPAQTLSYGSYNAPRYGIVINAIEPISVYYNYGESFAFQSGLDTYGTPYVPSIGHVKEIGTKLMLNQGPKGSISASFAHIEMEVTNVRIVFTQGPGDPVPGASGNKAAGTQHNKGFQWNVNMNRNFEDLGSLNFMVNQYHGDIRNELGIRPAKIPNNTWGAVATFNFKKGPLNGFKINGSAAYVGQQGGFTFPTTGGATGIEPRTITNAMIGYHWKRYDFQLNVSNLADKVYVAGAESALWIYADPGREFKFSAAYRY